jgi:uncharacterized protein with PQ loop repeat
MVQDSVLHHFHKRERVNVKCEPHSHPKKWKKVMDKLIYVVAFIGPIMTLPQIIKIWGEKNAAGVSVASWATFSVLSIFWIIYGIMHEEKPIIISSTLWFILDACVVLGTLMYG